MYVRVAVARPLPSPLTYSFPAVLGEPRVGQAVLVPLGSTGELGFVLERLEAPDLPLDKVRPISRLLDAEPVLDERQLKFCRWIADYYLEPLGLVLQTAVPAQVGARVSRVLEPGPGAADALAARTLKEDEAAVLREVVSRPGLTRRGLLRRIETDLPEPARERALDRLLRRGLIVGTDREPAAAGGRVRIARLLVPFEEAVGSLRGAAARQRALLARLATARGAALDVAELARLEGAQARPALQRLVELGLVALEVRERRDLLEEAYQPDRRPELNPAQRAAVAALRAGDAAGPWLLFGVTGSGKTEVFLQAAASTLASGRQVLVLVPEIGLTPQLIGRFRARLGVGVAALHSGLTPAERMRHWRAIRAGEVAVAVGARSALFAPFHDLGLIVVDEEHDDSYKQGEGVGYHARDLAVVLGREHRCPVVLASATPSLESWQNARTGRYRLLRLPERATPRPVPSVERVDLTRVSWATNDPEPLAPEVAAVLAETFAEGGQAVVLYNRRGFATLVECTACGAAYECPSCGVSLTLHRQAGLLQCHYCGLKRPYSGDCPVCQATASMEELGKGTERIESWLQERFPGVVLARVDADTTAARGSLAATLEAFREGQIQMLVGTQIIAKGHDFPGVQTAVVVSADRGFRMPDFRAAERTHALLVQVAGRAGRGERPGRVLVQTWNPDHYALQHLDDVEGFLEHEAELRRRLRYPPFTRLCLVRAEGVDRSATAVVIAKLAQALRQLGRGFAEVDVLGPAAAALPRLVGRWRFQLVLRGPPGPAFRAFLAAAKPVLTEAPPRGVRLSWDVDPRHLM